MFGKSPQKLVHLPRQQPHQATPSQRVFTQRAPDLQLPRGECRFILPDVEHDGSRLRCNCASFSLNTTVPGSLCGCGHQAWHHVTEPVGNYVPLDEHLVLMEKVKILEASQRRMHEDMAKERKEREKAYKDLQTMVRGNYGNMAYLKYYIDEKLERLRIAMDERVTKSLEELEEALDKAHDAAQTSEDLAARVATMDEHMILLEERLDSGRFRSRSPTPVTEGFASGQSPQPQIPQPPIPERAAPEMPVRTMLNPSTEPGSWEARVILVPRRFQQFAFNPDGVAYRRCQSRGFHQDIVMVDQSSEAFVKAIDDRYSSILKGRSWMPLQCLKSSDMSLNQLNAKERDPKTWSYEFLEAQCLAYNKQHGGDVIFIALQNDLLSWKEIHSLPRSFGSDESCWEFNEDLDDKARQEDQAMSDYNVEQENAAMSRPPIANPTDGSYDLASPPPYSYSGRSFSDARSSRLLPPIQSATPLDLLANASYMVDKSAPPSISDRSVTSMASIDSTLISARSASSVLEGNGEFDHHRDKRTKHGALRPHPLSGPTSPTQSSNRAHLSTSPTSSEKPQYMYSGRTKRKISTAKQKEPMDWRVSEMNLKNPMKRLLHPRQSQESSNEKRPQTSGAGSSSQDTYMES